MILEIVQYGHPVLRKKCRRVEAVSDEVRELAESMVETMREANGVGLAAPQVGVDTRLAVVEIPEEDESVTYVKVDGEEVAMASLMPLIFMNPELEFGSRKESAQEGCLSIQGIGADVRRPADLKGTFELLDGRKVVIETDGLFARAIQHETDHLNGVLFIDRVSAATKLSLKRRLKRLQEEE